LVIRQSKECLDDMNEWCQVHHVASGLAEQVLKSEISERDAEKQAAYWLLQIFILCLYGMFIALFYAPKPILVLVLPVHICLYVHVQECVCDANSC